MNDNIRTREGLARTFAAACKASTTDGMGAGPEGIPLNAAGIAGFLLHACGSVESARAAALRMPSGAVWGTVLRYLDDLAAEETADTLPPTALAANAR